MVCPEIASLLITVVMSVAAVFLALKHRRERLLSKTHTSESTFRVKTNGGSLPFQVELFVALCKALPHLDALRSLELEGLRKAFHKVTNVCAGCSRFLRTTWH